MLQPSKVTTASVASSIILPIKVKVKFKFNCRRDVWKPPCGHSKATSKINSGKHIRYIASFKQQQCSLHEKRRCRQAVAPLAPCSKIMWWQSVTTWSVSFVKKYRTDLVASLERCSIASVDHEIPPSKNRDGWERQIEYCRWCRPALCPGWLNRATKKWHLRRLIAIAIAIF